jgi:hypothetical protein
MDQPLNDLNNRFSNRLPVHSPDAGVWNSIASQLDVMDADIVLKQRLSELPGHKPDENTWTKIVFMLNRAAFARKAVLYSVSTAAAILVLLTFYWLQPQTKTPYQKTAFKAQSFSNNSAGSDNNQTTSDSKKSVNMGQLSSVGITASNGNQATYPVSYGTLEQIESESAEATLPTQDNTKSTVTSFLQNIALLPSPILNPIKISNIGMELAPKPSVAFIEITPEKPLKYYTPKEKHNYNPHSKFAVAMQYLPESIDNGFNSSVFHNVDLTASIDKEKVRFNTSFGLAYNEQKLEFDMNYDVLSPVTAVNSYGQLDTIDYNRSSVESQYTGSEKHQYFTYNLGFGRRIMSFGRFSTWINAAAGFGIRLNNPDLIAETKSKIKNQHLVSFATGPEIAKPNYNQLNINFITGVDFNYSITRRLVVSLTPTGRWYFKPVFTLNNQPTDELTLGFRSGLKFIF